MGVLEELGGAEPTAPPRKAGVLDYLRMAGQNAYEHLPEYGGLAGGIGGGLLGAAAGGVGEVPGGVLGATAGGTVGKALQQGIGQALGLQAPPQTAAEGAAGALGQATAGASQGIQQLLGEGVAKGVSMVGRPLMAMAARSTPEVARTLIDEGVSASRAGLQKLKDLIGSGEGGTGLAGKLRQALTTAGQNGLEIHPVDMAARIDADLMPSIKSQAIHGEDVDALQQLNARFVRDHSINMGAGGGVIVKVPQPMTPVELHVAAQKANKVATPIWNRIEKGEQVNADEFNYARWAKSFYENTKQVLEPAVDQFGELNAQMKPLIDASKALRGVPSIRKGQSAAVSLLSRTAPMLAGSTVGGAIGAFHGHTPQERVLEGLGGAGAGALAGSPLGLSSMALLLNNPALLDVLRQTPRAAASVFLPQNQ